MAQKKHHIVIYFFVILLSFLNIFDCICTSYFVFLFGKEMEINPIMRLLLTHFGISGFILFKTSLLVLILYLITFEKSTLSVVGKNSLIIFLFFVVTSIYLFVCGIHVANFINL